MAKIVSLKGGPVEDNRKPNADAIVIAEELLDKAKSGEIQGWAQSASSALCSTASWMISSRIEIIPATMADVTYIGANMREQDRRELFCQLAGRISASSAVAAIFASCPPDWSWVATHDGNPAAAFGFAPYTAATWCGWAFGTVRLRRCIPAITRFCKAQEDRLIEAGCRRLEVRTIHDHDVSHQWLAGLGAVKVCDLPDFGTNGEEFQLWAWWLSMRNKPHG